MPTVIVYKVVDWDNLFENSRTRQMTYMQWVPIPNKFDGDGYTELLDHPNGPAHYGVWVAVTLLASKCHPRGTLMRAPQRPHDVCSISRITRMPEKLIREALPRLVSVGWLSSETLTIKEVDASLTQACQEGDTILQGASTQLATERNGTERNGTEEKVCSELAKTTSPELDPIFLTYPIIGGEGIEWDLRQSKVQEWRESYPGLDVEAELRRALQWCRDNPKRRKTHDGMLRFLNRWLADEQNKGGRVQHDAKSKGPVQRRGRVHQRTWDDLETKGGPADQG